MSNGSRSSSGSSNNAPLEATATYAYAFSALCVAMIGAMFLAFMIGGYTVFNSGLGSREAANPVTFVPIFIFGAPLPFFSSISLADIFAGLWAIYIILFTIVLNGPKQSFVGVIRKIKATSTFSFYDNSALVVITSFSVLMVAFLAIDFLQGLIGVPTGTIPENPPIRSFTLMSWAPISEEIGFRVTLIGGVALIVLLSQGRGLKSLKVLWHPSRAFEEFGLRRVDYISVIYFAIVVSSLFFGAAHIIYNSSWEIGKVPTAAIAGFVIGWVYFKNGFPASVLLHWSFNFLSGSYVYFSCALSSAAGRCEDVAQNSLLVNSFEALIVTTGILGIGMLMLNLVVKRRWKQIDVTV
ncbi:MAG: CPBP family intramembrane metalloprotease [Thaumarchaeota archaeon]|nr:CPBP family intramembrane metalloprotease [Nitrososphaerota archaeon]MCL5317550.1 CPBP family intramembrane metalloprotease [Nitrososphaerota archaeon]